MSRPKVVAHDAIRTTAASGGRRLTLDPVRVIPLTLELREIESAIPCGLQNEWGTVDIDGDELSLTAGAGFGSQWGTIRFRGRDYCWSISDLATAFLAAVGDEPGKP